MPRKKRASRRRNSREEYARVASRVNSYKVRAEAALNHNARNAEYAFRDTEDEPLYHFLAHLEIAATCTYPEERAGDEFDLTIYGEDHPDSDVFWKLKDVQVVGEYHAPQHASTAANASRSTTHRRVWVCWTRKGAGRIGEARSGRSRAS